MAVKGERKFTGMLHDLTKRARLEDELRASEGAGDRSSIPPWTASS
jgi:hypothetical protein